MLRFWISAILMVGVGLSTVDSSPPGHGGGGGFGSGFLSGLFVPRFNIPEEQGQRTEEVLPPIVKEHHEHTWVKKPIHQVQNFETFGKQRQQILHNHVQHQKIIHQNHQHQHVLNEHTQHNVHTHNLHNLIQHIHEHTKEQQHIHKPIYHEYEHHQHKVTNEHVTKHTEANKVKHAHEQVVTNVHAEPIHQKEWSFLGWLRAWTKW